MFITYPMNDDKKKMMAPIYTVYISMQSHLTLSIR